MLIRDFSESDFLHILKWLTDDFRVIILLNGTLKLVRLHSKDIA